ncbi:hypothetical protein IQ250_02655 [Pseudanabaenaceae cyanobacterium LEGE 13415]|nr:hypothetical protein [Pseudanabaenaceae cyanobacterium LEGE 13415]
MTLPLPNLDDRTYADLVAELRALIPIECSEWTDHNPSDTGMILIELFAWLTELTLYRVNQVPIASQVQFLSLLGDRSINQLSASDPNAALILKAKVRETIAQLRTPYRAITSQDFKALVLQQFGTQIQRVFCLPNFNLDRSDYNFVEGHLSLVIVPHSETLSTSDLAELCQKVYLLLSDRCLLTTRPHVALPTYAEVSLVADLYLEEGASRTLIDAQAKTAIETYFNPRDSGEYWKGLGYPFGQDIYVSAIYERLSQLPRVQAVENVKISAVSTTQLKQANQGRTLVVDRIQGFRINDIVCLGDSDRTYTIESIQPTTQTITLTEAPGEFPGNTTVTLLRQRLRLEPDRDPNRRSVIYLPTDFRFKPGDWLRLGVGKAAQEEMVSSVEFVKRNDRTVQQLSLTTVEDALPSGTLVTPLMRVDLAKHELVKLSQVKFNLWERSQNGQWQQVQ